MSARHEREKENERKALHDGIMARKEGRKDRYDVDRVFDDAFDGLRNSSSSSGGGLSAL